MKERGAKVRERKREGAKVKKRKGGAKERERDGLFQRKQATETWRKQMQREEYAQSKTGEAAAHSLRWGEEFFSPPCCRAVILL